jgi:diguanylate cyclase (GGDEF)-like protein
MMAPAAGGAPESPVFAALALPALLVDLRGTITAVNAAGKRLWRDAEPTGRLLSSVLGALSAEKLLRVGLTEGSVLAASAAADGELVTLEELEPSARCLAYCSGLRSHSWLSGFVVCLVPQTREDALVRSLNHRVAHDGLTGLLNRDGLLAAVERDVSALPADSSVSHALVFVDLDHFKWINDTLGHAVGDALLQGLAYVLREAVRPGDLVSRVSGDEFVLFLRGIRGADEATTVVERVLERLTDGIDAMGHHVVVTASIGIALAPRHGQDAATLLRLADAAMYGAKQAGRARWRLFDGAAAERLRRFFHMREAIAHGLRHDAFLIAAQPIVELRTGAVVGHEVLVRLCVEGELLLPEAFLEVAHASGFLRPIGRWVRQEALGAVALGRLGAEGRFVALNVSPRELHPGFVTEFEQDLRQFGVEPSRVVVELTEDAWLAERAAVVRQLHELAELGVQLALDDFGTGASSILQLLDLPYGFIKLDRRLGLALASGRASADAADRVGQRVVTAVLELAAALERPVIAEGVERAETVEALLAAGCRYGQGALFGKPELVSGGWASERAACAGPVTVEAR